MIKNLAVILAGGAGERCQGPLPKQFLKIAGRSLLEICLEKFHEHPGIAGMVLVCPPDRLDLAEKTVSSGSFAKVVNILAGGKTRQQSSFIGVTAAPPGVENIMIHDAARALVPVDVITRVLEALASAQAVMPVLPESDTVVRVDASGSVAMVIDRVTLRRVQTPQGFKPEIIRLAHEKAYAEGIVDASDDCSLVLRYKLAPVATVRGDPRNIKITVPQDLLVAEALWKRS